MQEAYIVAGYRTAVGKSKRGKFRFYRPDDMAIDVIKGVLASVPLLVFCWVVVVFVCFVVFLVVLCFLFGWFFV